MLNHLKTLKFDNTVTIVLILAVCVRLVIQPGYEMLVALFLLLLKLTADKLFGMLEIKHQDKQAEKFLRLDEKLQKIESEVQKLILANTFKRQG